MAEMVERVARAIAPEAWSDNAVGAGIQSQVWARERAARQAIRAIEAMREPTEAMNAAAEGQTVQHSWSSAGEM